MKVYYKHEVTRSFLVIEPDGQVDTKAYPLRMILGNSIPGLLPCRLQKADGKILFYYDVTARQQLSDFGSKLTYEELRNIYQGLLKIFEQMDGYLLDTSQLLLDAEYIYLDPQTEHLYLCYLPGYETPIQEQLLRFTEYLLPLVDHQDSRGVTLSYGVYRLLAKKGFQTEAVGELIRQAEAQKNGDTESAEQIQILKQREPFPNIPKSIAAENDKALQKKAGAKQMLLFLAGFLFLSGILIFRRMGYLSGITLPVMLAVLFAGILAAAWTVRKEKSTLRDESVCESTQHQGAALVCEETGQAPPILLEQDIAIIGEADEAGRTDARVQKKEDGYWISRLSSETEIFLNGKRLESEEEYLLRPEDRVVLDGRCYRFTE